MSYMRTNVIYSTLGYLIPILVSLFSTPYIVSKLNNDLYGLYVTSISIIAFMSVADLGFGQGVIKYISHYYALCDHKKISQILNTSFVVYMLMGLIGSTAIFFISRDLARAIYTENPMIELASSVFQIASVGFFLNFNNQLFINIPKAFSRFDIAVKLQNFMWASNIFITVALLLFGKSLQWILVGYIAVQLATLMISYMVVGHVFNLSVKWRFHRETFFEIFSFSLFSFINSISGSIVYKLDKIIIASVAGTQVVTQYQLPFMITQMANGLIGSVSQIIFPKISEINSTQEQDSDIRGLFIRLVNLLIVLSLIVSIVIYNGSFIFLHLWMGEGFAVSSHLILKILSIIFFFLSSTYVVQNFYLGLGDAKTNMISSIIGTTAFLLSIVYFLELFSGVGAAMAFGMTLSFYPVYHYLLVKRLSIDKRKYFMIYMKSILIIILNMILCSFFNIDHISYFCFGYVDLLLVGVYSLFYVIIFGYVLGLIDLAAIKDIVKL